MKAFQLLMIIAATLMLSAPSAQTSQSPSPTPPSKKQFIIYLRARDTFLKDATNDERKLMFSHIRHLASLHTSRSLLIAGRHLTQPIAVCVIETADETEARALVEADPAVKSGLLKFEVHTFDVAFLEGRPAPKF